MTQPPPTLSYAPRPPTRRLQIFAGILLLLWSLFDLPAGLILTIGGIAAYADGTTNLDFLLSFPFLLLGPLTLFYSFFAFINAIRTLNQDPIALRRRHLATKIAELIWWPAFLILLPLAAWRDHAFDPAHHDNLLAWLLGSLLALLIPTAITLTRILLKKALRANPIVARQQLMHAAISGHH